MSPRTAVANMVLISLGTQECRSHEAFISKFMKACPMGSRLYDTLVYLSEGHLAAAERVLASIDQLRITNIALNTRQYIFNVEFGQFDITVKCRANAAWYVSDVYFEMLKHNALTCEHVNYLRRLINISFTARQYDIVRDLTNSILLWVGTNATSNMPAIP